MKKELITNVVVMLMITVVFGSISFSVSASNDTHDPFTIEQIQNDFFSEYDLDKSIWQQEFCPNYSQGHDYVTSVELYLAGALNGNSDDDAVVHVGIHHESENSNINVWSRATMPYNDIGFPGQWYTFDFGNNGYQLSSSHDSYYLYVGVEGGAPGYDVSCAFSVGYGSYDPYDPGDNNKVYCDGSWGPISNSGDLTFKIHGVDNEAPEAFMNTGDYPEDGSIVTEDNIYITAQCCDDENDMMVASVAECRSNGNLKEWIDWTEDVESEDVVTHHWTGLEDGQTYYWKYHVHDTPYNFNYYSNLRSFTVDLSDPNDSPTADAGSDRSCLVGEEISFDGSGSFDPDGSIVSYSWDFDDGDSGNGKTTTHTYDSIGTYDVTLTVEDNDGATDTDTIEVTVEEESDEGPILMMSPNSHDFGELVEGETDSTTFDIWNGGTGALNYDLSENYNWIDVSPRSGSSTGEHDTITVTIDTTGLDDRHYSPDILINDLSNSIPYGFEMDVDVLDSGKPKLDFSFVHVTDLHLGAIDMNNKVINNVDIWNDYIVPDIKKCDPSFVLFTGDIVDCGQAPTGNPGDPLQNGEEWYKDFKNNGLSGSKGNWKLKNSNIPVYFCPGNHDAYWALGQSSDFSNYQKHINSNLKYDKTFSITGDSGTRHNIKIVSLNSGIDENDEGDFMPEGDGLSNSQINFLDNAVQSSEDLKIVLTHHPYIRFCGGLDGTFNNNRNDFINSCLNNDVDLVFSGHTHSGVNKPMDKSGDCVDSTIIDNNLASEETAFVLTDAAYDNANDGKSYIRKVDVYSDGSITVHTQTEVTDISKNKRSSDCRPILSFLRDHPNMFPNLRLLLKFPIIQRVLDI